MIFMTIMSILILITVVAYSFSLSWAAAAVTASVVAFSGWGLLLVGVIKAVELKNVLEKRDRKLNNIADSIQYWLDFQKSNDDGVTDDTVLYSFPQAPSRGLIKKWIRILRTKKMRIK